MAISLSKENFDAEVMQSPKPVIIDAYAEWCGPCKLMKPIFKELEDELQNTITFAQINVDEARELSISLGISSIPTFIFVKNGEIVEKHLGYVSKDVLRDKITQYLV